jgi:hypothetical protein
VGDPEYVHVLNNQSKRVPSCLTEVHTCKSDLNVHILADLLDALFQEIQAVAGKTKQSFHPGDCLVKSRHLLSVVLEGQLDKLAFVTTVKPSAIDGQLYLVSQ